MKATITVEQSKELQNKWSCKSDKQIEDGFIGIDGKHHDYERKRGISSPRAGRPCS